MTTPDIAGLCERLRVYRNAVVCGLRMPEYINPEGPEAADTLERQAAEIERLRGALENADRRLSRPDWTVQRDTVRTSIRATLTGEDT